jgi:hypothetical protein
LYRNGGRELEGPEFGPPARGCGAAEPEDPDAEPRAAGGKCTEVAAGARLGKREGEGGAREADTEAERSRNGWGWETPSEDVGGARLGKREGEGGARGADTEAARSRNGWGWETPSEDVAEMEDTELTELDKTPGGVARLVLREGVAPVFSGLLLGVTSWAGAVSTSISKGGVSSLKSGSTNSFFTGTRL